MRRLLLFSLSLLALTLAASGQDARKPAYDEAAYERLISLAERASVLANDLRWTRGHTKLEWVQLEDDHLALLIESAGLEEACRREYERQANSLSHLYLYLWARGLHDGALETVAGHRLERLGYEEAAFRTGQRYADRASLMEDGMAEDFQALLKDRQ